MIIILLLLRAISALTFCNYLKDPIVCREFNNTEVQINECNFDGPKIYRQLQCNYYGCTWSSKKRGCTVITKRPTFPPVPHYECYNLCLPKINNGVCDDLDWCMYGTDCADCGPRWVE